MITRSYPDRVLSFGESLADVQHWIANSPQTWTSTQSRSNAATQSWDLGVGYSGAMELARKGWSEGAKDLSDRLAAHMPARDKEDSWRYDVAGELPDIGRFLAGDPAHMKRHGHPKGHRPIISLAINVVANAMITAQQMANYGAALVTIVDQIENAGRRVDLVCAFAARQFGVKNVIGWQVKHAEDSLDLAAIAFSLGHPAALRRIGFAMIEHSATRTCPGYGHSTTITPDDIPEAMPGVLCLSGIGTCSHRCRTLDDAIAFATEQVNTAAGEELVTISA
jgi:hypothetical protein